MRFLLSLALLALAMPVTADDTVTVRLDVDLAGTDHKDCWITVPVGSDGGAVLDAAVDNGCILEWSYDAFDGYGRYVTSVDYVLAAGATFWALYLDGEFASIGIDDMAFAGGETLRLDYQQWIVA